MIRRTLLAGLLCLGSCAAPGWDGEIERWGTLREVLREGHSEARVEIARAVRSKGTVGIGLVAGLEGEVAVIGGEVWIASAPTPGACVVVSDENAAATFLVLAHVTRWREQRLEHDLAAGELDLYLDGVARQHGLDTLAAWPFVIEGELDLQAHVLRGSCPLANAAGPEPYRHAGARERGRLIGFYAAEQPGVLTHHGERTHVHAAIPGDPAFAGHVDSVALHAGAWIRVPVR